MTTKNPLLEYAEEETTKETGKGKRKAIDYEALPFAGPWLAGNFNAATGHTLPYLQKGVGEGMEWLQRRANALRMGVGLDKNPVENTPSVGEFSQSLKDVEQSSPGTYKAASLQGDVGRGMLEQLVLGRAAPIFNRPTKLSAGGSGGLTSLVDRGVTNAVDADLAQRRGEEGGPSPMEAAFSGNTATAGGIGALGGALFQGLANKFFPAAKTAASLPKIKGLETLPDDVRQGVIALHERTSKQGMQLSLPELIENYGRDVLAQGDNVRGNKIISMGQTMLQQATKNAEADPALVNQFRNVGGTNAKIAGTHAAKTTSEAERLAAEAEPLIARRVPITNAGVRGYDAIKAANQLAPDQLINPTGLLGKEVQKDAPGRIQHAIHDVTKQAGEAADPAERAALEADIPKLTTLLEARAPSVAALPGAQQAAQEAGRVAETTGRKLPSMVSNPAETSAYGLGGLGAAHAFMSGHPGVAAGSLLAGPAFSAGKKYLAGKSANASAESAEMMLNDPMKALGLIGGGRTAPTQIASTTFEELMKNPEVLALLGRTPFFQDLRRD